MKRIADLDSTDKIGGAIAPMSAQLSDKPPFDNKNWIFEIKWDGYRAMADINRQKGNKLYSKNGVSFAKKFKKIYDALGKIEVDAVIDGEIVVYGPDGKPSFNAIQNYRSSSNAIIHYQVFDCLKFKGKSIADLPLLERKKILEKVLPANSLHIIYLDHVAEEGISFFREILKLNLEGMIAKRKQSVYQTGKRSANWLKIKNIKTQDVIIVGYTAPEGSRSKFGALLLGVMEVNQLVYVGSVGTGFSDRDLKSIYRRLSDLVRKDSPLDVRIKAPKGTTWVDPLLVASITYQELSPKGIVRHPSFQGLRIDVDPKDVCI